MPRAQASQCLGHQGNSGRSEHADHLRPRSRRIADRARQIAQQMASGLNATLGPLVYASNEAPARTPQPLMRAQAMMAPAPVAKEVEPLSVSAQKVTASATVYAVFSIQ